MALQKLCQFSFLLHPQTLSFYSTVKFDRQSLSLIVIVILDLTSGSLTIHQEILNVEFVNECYQ